MYDSYAERLAEVGAIASIGTVGDSYDNAMAESVVGLYQNECVKIDGPFRCLHRVGCVCVQRRPQGSWSGPVDHRQ